MSTHVMSGTADAAAVIMTQDQCVMSGLMSEGQAETMRTEGSTRREDQNGAGNAAEADHEKDEADGSNGSSSGRR